MARYWVGGSGSWDAADTSHWAATSGGASGASVPTSSDDVTFDTLSNATAYTATIAATANCRNVSFGAPASGNMTLAGSAQLTVFGNFALYAGLIRTFTGTISFEATATGKTIAFAGVSMASTIYFFGVGGGWTLQDGLTDDITLSIQVLKGALDTNGQTLVTGEVSFVGSFTRVLTLGATAWTCTKWTVSGSNYTLNPGTSVITATGGSTFTGGGLTYATVVFTSTANPLMTGVNAFGTLSRTNATGNASLVLGANQSASVFSAIGADGARIAIVSSVAGTPRTITAAALYLSNADPSADIIFVDLTGSVILAPAVLSYNSKHIFLTQKAYRFPQPDRTHLASRSKSASGIVETLNIRVDEIISLSFRNFRKSDSADATLKRNIQQWFQWAQNGNDWSFALYGAESFVTTLSAAAAVGATTLTPASVAGIQAGRTYILRSSTQMDIVKVLTVGASTITLVEGLNFAFAIGDRFRSEYYWPGKLMEAIKPIVERPPLFWDLDLDFFEDVNDL